MKTIVSTIKVNRILKGAILPVIMIMSLLGFGQVDSTGRGQISSNGSAKKEKPKSDIKTLFGSNNMTHGGFGAASVSYSEFNDQGAILVGGRGGWIINHSVAIGLGGYGIASNVDFENSIRPNDTITLNGGYGGLYLEFITFPKFPVHISFPIMIGAGGMAYHKDNGLLKSNSNNDDDYDRRYTFIESDAFFVIEPGVELEMNVLRFFRVALGASYRYLGDLKMENTKKDAFDGINAGVTFKFGRF